MSPIIPMVEAKAGPARIPYIAGVTITLLMLVKESSGDDVG
jgi:hypothetical protein